MTEWDVFRALDLARLKSAAAAPDRRRPAQHLPARRDGAARLHLCQRRPARDRQGMSAGSAASAPHNLPRRPSSGAHRPHRRAAPEPRHARRHRLLVHAPLSQGVPLRPPRHRGAAPQVVADPQPHHPDGAARAGRAGTTTRSGTGSATRARSRPSPASRRRSSARALADERIVGRLGHALRQPGRGGTPRRAAGTRAATASCWCRSIPQYAAATTATACDQAFRALMALRWQPTVRVAPPYFDDAGLHRRRRRLHPRPPRQARLRARGADRVLPRHAAEVCSSRAIPTTANARRPRGSCASGWAGRETAGTRPSSRSSAAIPWLQPYTIDTVERLAKVRRQAPRHRRAGLRRRLPGDAGGAGHGEPRQAFLDNGGEKFAYIPCLNDSPLGMGVIEQIVRRELAGWI